MEEGQRDSAENEKPRQIRLNVVGTTIRNIHEAQIITEGYVRTTRKWKCILATKSRIISR